MVSIKQTGNNNQASLGSNSPNIKGNNNSINSSKESKILWYIIIPIVIAIITGVILLTIEYGVFQA